jgi:hypothetical protein
VILLDHAIVKELKQTPKIEKHAKERAEERYGMSAKEFGEYVGRNSRYFKYVSTTYGYSGGLGRMFTYEGKTFILHLTENAIITTYPCDMKKATNASKSYARKLKKTALNIFDTEVQKIERAEAKAIRKLELFRAEIELEIGTLRINFARARSIARKIALKARIHALESRLTDIPGEEATIRIEKMRKIQALNTTFHMEIEARIG